MLQGEDGRGGSLQAPFQLPWGLGPLHAVWVGCPCALWRGEQHRLARRTTEQGPCLSGEQMTCGSFRVHGASAQPWSPGGGSVWHGGEGSLQRGTQGSPPSPLPSPHSPKTTVALSSRSGGQAGQSGLLGTWTSRSGCLSLYDTGEAARWLFPLCSVIVACGTCYPKLMAENHPGLWYLTLLSLEV